MGLLVLSYVGSFLVGRRSATGVGLPSGIEYAALGFVLGPQVLGLFGAKDLSVFEPVVQVALGWLAFRAGLDFGFDGDRRVSAGRLVFGSFESLLVGGVVWAAMWSVLRWLRIGLTSSEMMLLCGGVAAACGQTTREALRRETDRLAAHGPLARTLSEIAHSDDLLPLIAVAILFAVDPPRVASVRVPLRDWPLITVALGAFLGGGAALLVRADTSLQESWSVVLGVVLLAVGAATRLGLSTLAVTFFAGLALSTLSRHSGELRAMVRVTERPVLLPALLLAGARLDFRSTPILAWLAAGALVARLAAKLWAGWALTAISQPARKAGPLVGLSLVPSGAVAMSIGLAFALRFPGPVGDTVLAIAVLSAAVGELVGPLSLRRALRRAGEIEGPVDSTLRVAG
jgi:Kef-type K+ transport system membrane component KefB